MLKRCILLCLAVCATAYIFGQGPASIAGTITDKTTGEPLISAVVQVGNQGTTTDFEGKYLIEVSPGEQLVQVSYIGYASQEKTVLVESGLQTVWDISLEETANLLQTATVTSGRYEKPLSEVTVSLEVLQPDLIQRSGKTSMDDALQKVPGLTVIDGQANIRGGSGYSYGAGSRVLLLVDDMPILQPDSGYPNWSDVPVENTAQVEVIKGAASALYGSTALNGIVNVRTAYAKSVPETEVSAWYTGYGAPKEKSLKWWNSTPYSTGLTAAHRRKIGEKFDLVLGGYYNKQDSYNEDTYLDFGRFNFSTRYRASDRLTFGVNGNINNGKTGDFFYWRSYAEAYRGDTSAISERENLRYNLDPYLTYYDGAGNRHKVLGRFYRIRNDNSGNQSNKSYNYYGEYQFQRRWAEKGLTFSAGLVGQNTSTEAELYGDTTFTTTNLAGYAQIEKSFDRLNLSAGFRYEQNQLKNPGFSYLLGNQVQVVDPSDDKEAEPVLRLGANYKLGEYSFLRASWGQGYRFPTVVERYIVTNIGFPILPNPTLGSETGWSAELGLKQGFKIGNFNGYMDLSAFTNQYQNMIEFNLVGFAFQAVNIGDTKINGAEFTVAGQGELGSWTANILAGYVYIDPTFAEFDLTPVAAGEERSKGQINAENSSSDENILKYRSQHSAKMDLELSKGKFAVGWESFYFSKQEAIDNAFLLLVQGIQDYRKEYDSGWWINNFRVAYEPTDKIRLSLIGENVFNEVYSVRPGLLGAPNAATLRVDWKL